MEAKQYFLIRAVARNYLISFIGIMEGENTKSKEHRVLTHLLILVFTRVYENKK